MIETSIKTLCIFTVFLSVLTGCSQVKSKPITEVSQSELNSGILLDVRTPGEFSTGHINGALNVDWFREDFLGVIDTLPKSKKLFIYCQKGGRSARAARLLDSLGYQTVDLLGGYNAYRP